jgi:Ni/Fe-hydrogenase subunit HybB-like protein
VTRPPEEEGPVIEPGYTDASVTDAIGGIPLRRAPKSWLIGFAISFALLMLLIVAVLYLFTVGVGIWGVNIPVAWGFAIIAFVFWIGIGHAGTLISAILLLMHQSWRTSISRFTEAMTLFAIAAAGLFPVLHLGRPWLFYWLIPYPSAIGAWPQFRSPLVWDVFAISTYATLSLIFWYIGLVPDLASMRDRAKRPLAKIGYGVMALGWRGSAKHWHRYQTAYVILAALAAPLVVSVHSVVSFDFAVAIVPGWHSTIFPPYFVAGAIFSGFAMVVVLVIPIRKIYKLEGFITERHLENSAKVLLVTGLIVSYGYFSEAFYAWYSADEFHIYMMFNRAFGDYGVYFWALIAFNFLAPQVFWSRRLRRHTPTLFVVSLLVLLGMWYERFVIVVQSLHRDYMPSSWGHYDATFWDWATLLGSFGLFFSLLFVFIRLLPMVSISEVRELAHHERHRGQS